MSQDEKEGIILKLTLLSLVKVKLDFLLLDITEIWIRSKESDKNQGRTIIEETHMLRTQLRTVILTNY